MTPFLLSVPDAAKGLGVSERWVWIQIRAGKLPSVRLGRRVLVKPEDIETFVDAHAEAVKQ
jgi:excisionase family DNA binding protein